VIVKGILDPADARTAIAHGADGIVVSNHGGRQLESAPSALERLPRSSMRRRQARRLRRRRRAPRQRHRQGGRARRQGGAARPAPAVRARRVRAAGAADVLAILRGEFETTLRLLGVPQARRSTRRRCAKTMPAACRRYEHDRPQVTTPDAATAKPRRATARRSSSARSRRRSRCSRRSATRSG
jgi:hypothetical protein